MSGADGWAQPESVSMEEKTSTGQQKLYMEMTWRFSNGYGIIYVQSYTPQLLGGCAQKDMAIVTVWASPESRLDDWQIITSQAVLDDIEFGPELTRLGVHEYSKYPGSAKDVRDAKSGAAARELLNIIDAVRALPVRRGWAL